MCVMMALVMVIEPVDAKRRRKRKKTKWKTITYRIKKGDTLQGIAKKHKVKSSRLKRWNRGLNPRTLRIGRKLRIVVPRSFRTRSASVARQAVIRKRGFVPGRLVTQKEAQVVNESPFALAKSVQSGEETPRAPKSERVDRREVETQSKDGKKIKVITHKVRKGENVGLVALKYAADYRDIMKINKLRELTVDEGTVLKVRVNVPPPKPKGPMPVSYRVRKGDSFARIAKKKGISIKQLKRWNRRVNPRRLRAGQTLRLYVAHRGSGHSQSVGSPNRGRLYNGVPMTTTPGIRVRSMGNAYGTIRVVNMLTAAGADLKARWPDAPHLVVGDISYQRGGRIKKHKSHQSGRDADVSFYHKGDVQLPDFRPMHEDNFDAAKNWHVFKTLIDTGEVKYIFIDYPLQKVLYDYAISIGYTKDDLQPLIQYPRGIQSSAGIIRHVRGHDDHWHIRFKCGPKSGRCRD